MFFKGAKMKIKLLILISAISLAGCNAGNDLSYSKTAYKKTDMDFVGIPTILGLGAIGTRFPVTPHYSLTAKHVAKFSFDSVVSYHPTCDVALVKSDNTSKELPVLSSTGVGVSVVNYGYSFISALPVESSGYTDRYIKLENTNNNLACPAILSTAGVRKGMSGGPVYNKISKAVVGVNVSYTDSLSVKTDNGSVKMEKFSGSMFIPFQNFKAWLVSEVNKTEDKGLLKIDNEYDFYDNDSGDNKKDALKNADYLKNKM